MMEGVMMLMITSTRVSPSAASKLIVEINIQPALSASLTATLLRCVEHIHKYLLASV